MLKIGLYQTSLENINEKIEKLESAKAMYETTNPALVAVIQRELNGYLSAYPNREERIYVRFYLAIDIGQWWFPTRGSTMRIDIYVKFRDELIASGLDVTVRETKRLKKLLNET